MFKHELLSNCETVFKDRNGFPDDKCSVIIRHLH